MKNSSPTIVIGISGASGSGKTSIATALADKLGRERSHLLSLDAFYHDLSHLSSENRDKKNFDHPDAIDHQALNDCLNSLLNGESTTIPLYDFSIHCRKKQTTVLEPKKYIILEGIFALSYPDVRERLTLKLFVSCPEAVYLARRIQRDITERGRTRESVIAQCEETVLPAFHAYIEPQSEHADVVLDGTKLVSESIEAILQALRED
jgi:uridine kinase